jgi:hypothetical protein
MRKLQENQLTQKDFKQKHKKYRICLENDQRSLIPVKCAREAL